MPLASGAASSSAASAPSGSTAPTASASPSVSASAASSAGPAGSGVAVAGPPPIAFRDFSGPSVKPPVQVGERAWVVVPLSGAWEAVKLTIAPATEVSDDSIVVEQDDKRYRVPGAFVAKATRVTPLAEGDAVMASAKGTRVFGRVVDADTAMAHVRFKFAGAVEIAEIATNDLVKLDGSSFLGAPVSLRENKSSRPSQLIHLAGERAWVLTAGRAHAVLATDVAVLAAPLTFAKGAPVSATRAGLFAPAVVVDVLEAGLQYRINWDGSDETATTTYEFVIPRQPASGP